MPPNEDSNERKLTLSYIENLYNRLFLFPVSERIKDGLIADGWTDEVLKNRLKTARYLLKDWITPDGIAQFETDGLLSTESESMQYVCGKMGATDGSKFMLKVSTLFRCANLDIQMVAKTLDEVENLLNPQPDTTTEQEQTVRKMSILEDAEVKAVMQAVEDIGLMEYKDGRYYWTGGNALLSYLCSQISRYKGYSKQYREGMGDLPNWIKFEGIFKARGKRKDEWVEVDGNKLANYKKQHKRYDNSFSPDGCKDIDGIIERCIKI